MTKLIKKLKNDKVVGEDVTVTKLLKEAEQMVGILEKLLPDKWETEQIPEGCKCALINTCHTRNINGQK